MIQPSDRCIDLNDAINLILDFNKTIQLDRFEKHKTKNKQDEHLLCEVQKKRFH